jgi:hypothetical protein
MGMCPTPTFWWSGYTLALLDAFSWGRWHHTCLLRPACLFRVLMGMCPSPTLRWSFPRDTHCYKLSPLQSCWAGGLPSRLGAGSGGAGALLVSSFNVVWGCYVWAGGVEVSLFCLFLVAFPARCISSISPRIYFRKHAFCFLLLVIILECP